MRKNRWLFICIVILVLPILSFYLRGVEVSAEEDSEEPVPYLVVSLGDSYASGEGVEPFYDQKLPPIEKVKSKDWIAHRSENSWSGQLTVPYLSKPLSKYKDKYWFFEAVSGAVTGDILGGAAVNWEDTALIKHYRISSIEGDTQLPAQIEVFDQLPAGSVRYVTISIGGNDAGFSKAVELAITSTVTDLSSKVSDYFGINRLENFVQEYYKNDYEKVRKIMAKLVKTYKAISEKPACSNATILVAGYPTLLNEEGNPFPTITQKNAKILNDAVFIFNAFLEETVKHCRDKEGLDIEFVKVIPSKDQVSQGQVSLSDDESCTFIGHEAYTSNAYIQGLFFHVVVGPREDYDQKDKISRYSFHPNLVGIEVYRHYFQECIDELEKEKPYGLCGDKVTYRLTDDGVLTISGTGSMWNYEMKDDKSTAPWFSFAEKIRKVVIKEGVTYIGSNAFAFIDGLTDAVIASSVEGMGTNAFYHCYSLKNFETEKGSPAFILTLDGDFSTVFHSDLSYLMSVEDAPDGWYCDFEGYNFYTVDGEVVNSLKEGEAFYIPEGGDCTVVDVAQDPDGRSYVRLEDKDGWGYEIQQVSSGEWRILEDYSWYLMYSRGNTRVFLSDGVTRFLNDTGTGADTGEIEVNSPYELTFYIRSADGTRHFYPEEDYFHIFDDGGWKQPVEVEIKDGKCIYMRSIHSGQP